MKEIWLLAAAGLLILSVLLSKVATRLGVPSLLVVLGIGMLAGSDGLGGIYFDDFVLSQAIGVIALSFILFSGGMGTSWKTIQRILWRGLTLSTVGVLVCTALVGVFAVWVMKFSWLEGLLLGAIISSTDAAAVFALLRGKKLHLPEHVESLLELESASNDPMAVFLTVAMIQLLTTPEIRVHPLIFSFFLQMGMGTLIGYLGGRLLQFLIEHLHLEFKGLYSVLTLGSVIFIYASSQMIGGNGFLSVYIAGIVLSNTNIPHKKTLLAFHDALAWVMQIVMFLILGLLVFPHQFKPVVVWGISLAFFLVLVARPLSVYLSLSFGSFTFREKLIVSWTGLKGAVPIILATYPLLAGIPRAHLIFHLVFFVVLISVLLQGTTLPFIVRWLKITPKS